MDSRDITFNDLTEKTFDVVFSDKLADDHAYGFYDWFCKTSSLKNRAKVLWNKAKSIVRSTRFDPSKCYVFFKNNGEWGGKLYDDFRICDKESGDVLYTVTPKTAHGGAEVWGKDNDFEYPLVEGTWREVRMWFNN